MRINAPIQSIDVDHIRLTLMKKELSRSSDTVPKEVNNSEVIVFSRDLFRLLITIINHSCRGVPLMVSIRFRRKNSEIISILFSSSLYLLIFWRKRRHVFNRDHCKRPAVTRRIVEFFFSYWFLFFSSCTDRCGLKGKRLNHQLNRTTKQKQRREKETTNESNIYIETCVVLLDSVLSSSPRRPNSSLHSSTSPNSLNKNNHHPGTVVSELWRSWVLVVVVDIRSTSVRRKRRKILDEHQLLSTLETSGRAARIFESYKERTRTFTSQCWFSPSRLYIEWFVWPLADNFNHGWPRRARRTAGQHAAIDRGQSRRTLQSLWYRAERFHHQERHATSTRRTRRGTWTTRRCLRFVGQRSQRLSNSGRIHLWVTRRCTSIDLGCFL